MTGLIIENLELAPLTTNPTEMREYEPFECSKCGILCRMEIERFNLFTDEQIKHAVFKCRNCSSGVGRGRKSDELKNVTKEQLEQWVTDGLTKNEMCKRLNCNPPALKRRLRMFGLLQTQHGEPANQPKPSEIKHNDHIPEVSNMVERPPHYTSGNVECIDAIEAAVEGLPPNEAVLVANIIKYTWRYFRKNGLEDLHKARWYLDRLIQRVTERIHEKNEE